MGCRPKRARSCSVMTAFEVEEMLREMQGDVEVDLPPRPEGVQPSTYEEVVAAAGHTGDSPSIAVTLLRALRLALTLGTGDAAWPKYLDHHLSAAVRRLRSADDEFSSATATYLRTSELRLVSSPLRRLERLAAIDSLHFALWDLAHRRGQPA